jgi:hypothetical protein
VVFLCRLPRPCFNHFICVFVISQGICPCVAANKVISVDNSGTIVAWHLRQPNLSKVRVNVTAPSPSDALQALHGREYRNLDSGVSRYSAAAEGSAVSGGGANGVNRVSSADTQAAQVRLLQAIHAASADLATSTAVLDAVPATRTAAAPATPQAQSLTRDFERAVLHDPSIWSANTATTPGLPAADISAQRTSAAETAFAALYDADAPPSPKANRKASPKAGASGGKSGVQSAQRTRMGAKKPAAADTSALNTSTTSYDLLFDDAVPRPKADVNTSFESAGSAASRRARVNTSRSELNVSTASQQSRRSVSAGAVRRSHDAAVPGLPAPVSVDNPLEGLAVWKQLQSPQSGRKSRSKGRTAGSVADGVNSSGLYDSDAESVYDEDSTAEAALKMDTLDLLQRARANMHASRLGPVATTTTPTAAKSARGDNAHSHAMGARDGLQEQSTLPRAFFEAPVADEPVNVNAISHTNAGTQSLIHIRLACWLYNPSTCHPVSMDELLRLIIAM